MLLANRLLDMSWDFELRGFELCECHAVRVWTPRMLSNFLHTSQLATQTLLRKLLTEDLPGLMVLPKRIEIAIPPSVTSVAEAAVGRDTIMRAVASAVLQVRRESGAGKGKWLARPLRRPAVGRDNIMCAVASAVCR